MAVTRRLLDFGIIQLEAVTCDYPELLGSLFAMEMHQVRYFLAVAEELNFTRAAEKCNVSQPSLSRAIQLLEEEFGGKLF